MSLEYPAVDHSEKNSNITKSWTPIWIDKKNLLPIASCLIDIQKDTETAINQGLICSPEETLRLLYTIQYLTYNVFLGNGGTFENKMYSYKTNDGRYSNCIEQYIEFVYSIHDELLGWRIHYLIQDPKYSFEQALERYWAELEAMPKNKLPMKNQVGHYDLDYVYHKPRVFHPCASREIYLDYCISPYTGERFSDNGLRKTALNLSLTSPLNHASTLQSLTFAHSCKLIKAVYENVVKPEYLEIANYRGMFPEAQPNAPVAAPDAVPPPVAPPAAAEEEEDNGNDPPLLWVAAQPDVIDNNAVNPNNPAFNCIQFPFSAYRIEHDSREPNIFFKMDLGMPPIIDENMDQQAQRRIQRLRIQEILGDTKTGTSLKRAKMFCKNLTQGKTAEQIKQVRKSPEIRNLIRQVAFNDDENPGGQLLNDYCEEQLRINPNWSIITNEEFAMDETLTRFGNRVAKELYLLEMKCSVDVKHSEIFLTQMMTMMSFDVEDLKLRIHVLFYGPPGAGKSYIIEMHEKLSPEGLIHWIAMQTRKANTTEECFNGFQMCIDELHEMFTSKGDGQGFAEIKTLLSKGELEIEMAAVDEHHRRILLKTVSKRKCQYIANTNEPMSNLPEAVRDRFLRIFVPEQYRHNFDAAIEDEHLRTSSESKKELEKHRTTWAHRYLVANRYFTVRRFAEDLMPPISTSLAADVSKNIFDYLREECGISVELRNRQRVLAYAMGCCLFDAIEEVYFSGRVLEAGTPYDELHIFELIPYLQVSREHYYFAVSMLHSTIADPTLPFVLQSIKKMVDAQPDDKIKFAHGTTSDGLNYNYYFLPVKMSVSRNEVTKAIAESIVSMVHIDFNQTLHVPAIIDLVNWMTKQHKDVHLYDNNNMQTNQRFSATIAHERQGGTFRPGLEISRQFVDHVIQMTEPVVITAIKRSIDRYCKIPRFVTGITYRYGLEPHYGVDPKYIFPFIFQVIETAECKRDFTMSIRNPAFFRHGYDFLMGRSSNKAATIRYIKVNQSIDDMAIKQWRDSTSHPPETDIHPPDIKYLGDYPMGIIAGVLLEYGVNINLPSTDRRPERAPYHAIMYLEQDKEMITMQIKSGDVTVSHRKLQKRINKIDAMIEKYRQEIQEHKLASARNTTTTTTTTTTEPQLHKRARVEEEEEEEEAAPSSRQRRPKRIIDEEEEEAPSSRQRKTSRIIDEMDEDD